MFRTNADELYPIIYASRISKTAGEIEVMKASIRAAAEGHLEIMKKCKPGMRESQLACYLRYLSLSKYNIRFKAYPDIIGSGKNSSILHYSKNSKIIADGDLVLCDCGHRIHGYCSDITTTFPANGKFNTKQKYI